MTPNQRTKLAARIQHYETWLTEERLARWNKHLDTPINHDEAVKWLANEEVLGNRMRLMEVVGWMEAEG